MTKNAKEFLQVLPPFQFVQPDWNEVAPSPGLFPHASWQEEIMAKMGWLDNLYCAGNQPAWVVREIIRQYRWLDRRLNG